jgi:hypothetical protein
MHALGVVLLLGLVEVGLSFDNAVVNAAVLRRMPPFWRRMFLTVGVVIAVVGMRLAFPLLVVCVSAHLSPVDALRLAAVHPGQYADRLTEARPAIAAFGGVFLLMVFLDFFLADREQHWLRILERPLARLGRLDRAAPIIALLLLVLTVRAEPGAPAATVLLAGVLGLIAYMLVSGLNQLAENNQARRAGLIAFLYLELLDASFSFDGVIGALAITADPVLIMAGLGIGAIAVRALTVHLVREGTLTQYAYLEHGAHYAIGALGLLLIVTVEHEISDWITGLVGAFFIVSSLVTSLIRNSTRCSG